jgi:c-di-GMP-binding flagellar brake protein YcgR
MAHEPERKRLRINFEVSATIKASEECFEVISRDLSLGGMYALTDKILPVDSTCIAELHLGNNVIRRTLIIIAKVTRTDDKGFGLTFQSMDKSALFHLKNLILHNIRTPEQFLKQCEDRPGFQ